MHGIIKFAWECDQTYVIKFSYEFKGKYIYFNLLVLEKKKSSQCIPLWI